MLSTNKRTESPAGKIIFVFFAALLLTGSSFAASITAAGYYNFFPGSGSAADYVVGENEFPLTDAHSSFGFGLAFNTRLSSPVCCGIEAGCNFKSKTVIRDPSDNDSVEIDTYQYILAFATLGYRFPEQTLWGNKISFFARCGAGIYYLPGELATETYTTANNYTLEIEPAGRKVGFAGFLGVGSEINLYRNLWLVLAGRYLLIGSEEPQGAVVGYAGLKITF